MSRQLWANCAAGAVVAKFCNIKFAAVALLSMAALLLAGWRDAPVPPTAGANPADPRVRIPRVDYQSTIGRYKSQRPVEPGPWGEQNQRVAPQSKSGH